MVSGNKRNTVGTMGLKGGREGGSIDGRFWTGASTIRQAVIGIINCVWRQKERCREVFAR